MEFVEKKTKLARTEVAIVVPCKAQEKMKKMEQEARNRNWEAVRVHKVDNKVWELTDYIKEEARAKREPGIAIRAVSKEIFDQIISWASATKPLNEIVPTCAGDRWPPPGPLIEADPGYSRGLLPD